LFRELAALLARSRLALSWRVHSVLQHSWSFRCVGTKSSPHTAHLFDRCLTRRATLTRPTYAGFSARHCRVLSAAHSRHHEFKPLRSRGFGRNADALSQRLQCAQRFTVGFDGPMYLVI